MERDDVVRDLSLAWARVRLGRGEIALVSGEAGAGKSVVVDDVIDHLAGAHRVLRGGCDPLAAPRPFGPLLDAAAQIAPDVAARLAAGATRAEAFAAAVSLLTAPPGSPAVFVVEDVHWADEATLDLLTYLGRRIETLGAWLVLTMRDDEVGRDHPLGQRLAELAAQIRCRCRLRPLTPDGVAQLAAGQTVDAQALHRMTGGNPFYVTEVLATGSATLPVTVREAVRARVAQVPAAARAVLDAAAVVPGGVERWLLEAIASDGVDVTEGLDECLERGLLVIASRGTIEFRHELARLAILDAAPRAQRRARHRRALAELRRMPTGTVDRARLAHHAVEAEDLDAIAELTPAAGRAAAAVGAHRQAVVHLEAAWRIADRLDPAERARVLLDLGRELLITGRSDDALSVLDEAVAASSTTADAALRAEVLVEASRVASTLGRRREAVARLEEATVVAVGSSPPTSALVELAWCGELMLARQLPSAAARGHAAIRLAQLAGATDLVAEASIQCGTAVMMTGDDAGVAQIELGMGIAEAHGTNRLVALGLVQIGSGMGELRRYDLAVPALERGIAWCVDHEVVNSEWYCTAWLARCRLETGRWDEAAELAGGLLRTARCVGISRIVALVTLGWVRARRGDPEVGELLDEALVLARRTRHLQRLWPVAACRAEAAWLAGRPAAELDLVDEVLAMAEELGYGLAIEELAFWRQRCGDPHDEMGDDQLDGRRSSTPFGLAVAGDPSAAAGRWAQLGCPYEETVALLLAGDRASLLTAHGIASGLGAVPLRARVTTALRAGGWPVPRGPLPASAANPAGLTRRQLEVLAELATGATNREIADALGISAKTVDHHVSGVLAKLGARSRAEAAVAAQRLGWLDGPAGDRLG